MELAWLSLCLVALPALFAFWFVKHKSEPQKRLPPGPWTLPIMGSLHHLSRLRHRSLLELSRRHGPLMSLRLGEVPSVVVSNAEAAAEVMNKANDVTFINRPLSVTQNIFGCGGQSILFAPYGDYWRQMRKVCMVELFSSKQVKRMEGIRADEVGNLLRHVTASIAAGTTIDLSDKMTALGTDIVSRAVYGGKIKQQDEYLRAMDEAFQLLGGFCLVDLFPSSRLVRWLSNGERHMKRCRARTHGIIADVIQDRKKAAADPNGACISPEEEDMLDVLLRLQREDTLESPLTTERIAAVLFDIIGGATDTTGSVLEWAMSELINNPNAMAKAQLEVREVLGPHRTVITNSDIAKLHYIHRVIKEVLRLHPPGPVVPRVAGEDCQIMGYDVLKGTNVYINLFAISRDPKYWENPDEFKPDRFQDSNVDYNGTNFEFIPFSAGRRKCPGILFGSSILEIALTNLLYHFDWMLPNETKSFSLDMSEKFSFTLRRKNELHLKAIPYIGSKASKI